MPSIPSRTASSCSSRTSFWPKSSTSSPSYSFSFFIRLMPAFLDGSSRERTANMLATRRVFGAMWTPWQAALADQLLVDLDLFGDLQVVGHLDQDDPVVQRLGLLVGDERVVLVLVRVRDDHLVGVDHREAAGLDVLLLRQRQQVVEELLVALEHLDEFHQAAVRDVQLAVEAVGPRIALDAVLADRRQVDRAGQLGDVLRLRVGRREGADADSLLLREGDPLDLDVLDPAAVLLVAAPSGSAGRGRPRCRCRARARISLRMLVREQVQRLLVHRAAGDGVDGAVLVRGCTPPAPA